MKNRLNSKERHHRNLRALQRKQSKMQTRKRTESTAPFDGGAFLRDIAGVCERHGVAICVPVCALPGNELVTAAVSLDTSRNDEANELFKLCMEAVVNSPRYQGCHIQQTGAIERDLSEGPQAAWKPSDAIKVTLTPGSAEKKDGEGDEDNWEEPPLFKDRDGYLCAVLQHESGELVVKRIHELIAMSHLPNPENKTRVRHKDGNKENNASTNLEWC